ncbi:hypothetical protein ACLOJK_012222 [Asimina triloba]
MKSRKHPKSPQDEVPGLLISDPTINATYSSQYSASFRRRMPLPCDARRPKEQQAEDSLEENCTEALGSDQNRRQEKSPEIAELRTLCHCKSTLSLSLLSVSEWKERSFLFWLPRRKEPAFGPLPTRRSTVHVAIHYSVVLDPRWTTRG